MTIDKRLSFVSCAILLVFLLAGSPSTAVAGPGSESLAPHFIQQTNLRTQAFLTAEDVLRSKDSTEWTALEQQSYLVSAAWAVHSALFTYVLQESKLPSDLHELVDRGLLAAWPKNPYDGWSDMAVNANGLDFSAGDLSLQICPPSEFSLGGHDGKTEVPLTYELGVFAPSIEFASGYGNAQRFNQNASWNVVPEGTLFMTGGFAESAAATRAKIQELLEGGENE